MTALNLQVFNQENPKKRFNSKIIHDGIVIYFLSLALVVASIARLPILDQLEEVKIGLFGFEVFSVVLLLATVRRRSPAIAMMSIIIVLIFMRLVFGASIANLAFQQTLTVSTLESRFGIMLIAAPLAYYLFRDISSAALKKFIASYLLVLITLDILLFTTLASEDLLVLGLRTDNRFVCSVLIPLVGVALISIREKGNHSYERFVILASFGMLLHTSLVTTSRIETLFALGVLCFAVQNLWPRARWLLYMALIFGTIYSVANLFGNGQEVAGRNFPLAFQIARSGLPWGHGSVTDTTAKILLNLPDQFFFSDYGLLSYVMRYGLLGVIIVVILILFWLYFCLACLRLKGWIFLVLPITAYLTFIPLLDYGSLNGGFLLAFMMLVPIAQNQQRKKLER